MRHNRAAWGHAVNELKPDIGLFQEAMPPLIPAGDFACHSAVRYSKVKPRSWGNAIYSKWPVTEIELETDYEGCLIAAHVDVPDWEGGLVVINLYGLIEYTPKKETGYSAMGLHRMISDATFLINGRSGYARQVVLGGDFNLDRKMDFGWYRKDYASAGPLLDRIVGHRLRDCVAPQYPDGVSTFRNARKPDARWQLDHLFATAKEFNRLKSCQVLQDIPSAEISDHNPIIAEFDLS